MIAELNEPVPFTVALQALVCLLVSAAGVQATATEEMVGGVTVTVAAPDRDASADEVAVTVTDVAALRVAAGVKRPALLTAPALAGDTLQRTAVLNPPVPLTVALHALVWLVVMAPGTHVAATEVMVGGATVTVAVPDLVESCFEVAVMVALPATVSAALGVKSPAVLMAPIEAGLTVQLTVVLKAPVPRTVAAHKLVWVKLIELGAHETVTTLTVKLDAPTPCGIPPAAALASCNAPMVKRRTGMPLRLICAHPGV